ncbi:MAG: hypothetical protein JWO38_8223 [Gemmataceae bacterium]|nr:hypothetical protein [Gemmataceae bacterium]
MFKFRDARPNETGLGNLTPTFPAVRRGMAMKNEDVLWRGFAVLLGGVGVYLAVIGIGTGVHIAEAGLEAALGAGTNELSIARWAVAAGVWVVVGRLVLALVAGTWEGAKSLSDEAKRKPVMTISALLGIVALVVADVCKDTLPGNEPWQKNVFKGLSAILFAVAGWLFDSKEWRFRMAAIFLWFALPLAFALGLFVVSLDQAEGAKASTTLQAWGFVGAWLVLVGFVVVFSLAVRRAENQATTEGAAGGK